MDAQEPSPDRPLDDSCQRKQGGPGGEEDGAASVACGDAPLDEQDVSLNQAVERQLEAALALSTAPLSLPWEQGWVGWILGAGSPHLPLGAVAGVVGTQISAQPLPTLPKRPAVEQPKPCPLNPSDSAHELTR